MLATFIAVAYVDRFGRKPLLQIGLVGMSLSLTVVGICFLSLDNAPDGASSASSTSMAATFTLVGLVVFIASFAFSLGPVVWTVINEIYPESDPRSWRGAGDGGELGERLARSASSS